MTERFEIFPQNVAKDGTLIIIQKGLKLYNISDVVELLNALHEENQHLESHLNMVREQRDKQKEKSKTLQKQLDTEHQMLENAILLERTRMGKNCLKQFRDAIQ